MWSHSKSKLFIFSSVAVLFLFFQNCSKFQTLDGVDQRIASLNSNAGLDEDQNSSNQPNPNPTPNPMNPSPMPSQMPPLNTSGWSNKPSHLETISDTSHSMATQNGWYPVYGTDTVISDPTDPASAPGVLQQKFPKGLVGGNGGGGGSLVAMSKDYNVRFKEFFHGFYIKVDSQYEQHPVFTKISWLHTGLGTDVQGNQLFMGLVGPQGGPYSVNANYQNGNIDNQHLNGGNGLGTVRFDPASSAYTIAPGQWAKVEIYWKQSSCNTCRDGLYKVWVNGQSAVNVTTLNTDRIAVDSVSYITVWGGTGTVKSRDSYMWFGHSYLAGL